MKKSEEKAGKTNSRREPFRGFRSTQADALLDLIKTRGLLDSLHADAVAHALVDISESVERIYDELIPRLLDATDDDDLKDKFWDIREEFRHIAYHLDDANLTDL